MAMPYMEKAADPEQVFRQLVASVKERPGGMDHVLFEIQSTDWSSHQDLPSPRMAEQLRALY
jgi:biofilm PGA synthesis lipoprotein PgaB